MIKTQVEKISEKFDAGQQIFRRVSIEILLARIQQLEIQAAQQSMHPTSGSLLGLGELSKLEENPAPKILLTPPTCG